MPDTNGASFTQSLIILHMIHCFDPDCIHEHRSYNSAITVDPNISALCFGSTFVIGDGNRVNDFNKTSEGGGLIHLEHELQFQQTPFTENISKIMFGFNMCS